MTYSETPRSLDSSPERHQPVPVTNQGFQAVTTVHRIVSARPLPGYRLNVRFEDGVEGEVNLAHLVGKGVFAKWQDPAEFQKVFIDPESHTVAWPGEIDLCPESLYEDVVAAVAPCCARDKPPSTK